MFSRRAWRWIRRIRCPRGVLLAVVVSLAMLAPAAPAAPAMAAGDAEPSATLPLGGLLAAGISVVQETDEDPLRPVSVNRPVAAGQQPLSQAIGSWVSATTEGFRADHDAGSGAGELNVSWQVVVASGPVLGIRMETYEYAGTDGHSRHQVFYGDGVRTWTGAELVDPGLLARAAGLVRAAVAGSGRARPAGGGADDDRALLADATLVPGGALRVELAGPGTPLRVTLPRELVQPLLSDRGRAVTEAVGRGLPYAVSVPISAAPTPRQAATSSSEATAAAATAALAAEAAAAATKASPGGQPSSASTTAAGPGPVDCATVACVALTFDDGPGPFTATLLDELAVTRTPATFFVLGQNAQVHPDLIQRMLADGMTVASHTWDHRDLRRLSDAEAHAEVDRTAALLASLGVPANGLLRPPYGAFTAAARTLGQALVLWDVDTEDWRNRDVGTTTARALATARAGSIILMHDIHASTVAAVPGIVAELRARGFTLVTVPELLGPTQPGGVYFRRA